jgi:hypothetical protein
MVVVSARGATFRDCLDRAPQELPDRVLGSIETK